ncbi:hypothetical protein [Deinococcus hopiensis]|uniref:DUF4388 domain-containing protein n=1 Tax=Deinococcus hopiensis KR-140 TaxID=695939 RepID=A0A1W1VHU7_9DEIO|nr:hypothetical protein [Deinococcus hopiensis]SMB92932.1 hypothetical protein SAMN00790413_01768 [Deinococcus hopiensis KR-140]
MTSPGLPSGDDLPEEPAELIPELLPMFPGAAPFLTRFLPQSPALYAGLNVQFCDLHAFLKYLHGAVWSGYLHAKIGDESAAVLVYEGRAVTAAAANATGEQAFGELIHVYGQGASLSAHPLAPTCAHLLSGVGSRAWKFNLTATFTGLHASPAGATLYSRGEVIATMPVALPYEGAFPAPLRPQTLILPSSLAGWAHRPYALMLRGREALNPILDAHATFRTHHGVSGLALLKAVQSQITPAEYATRHDLTLHDLEGLLQTLLKGGYIREG